MGHRAQGRGCRAEGIECGRWNAEVGKYREWEAWRSGAYCLMNTLVCKIKFEIPRIFVRRNVSLEERFAVQRCYVIFVLNIF
jgi:hypothetical protein